MPPRHPEPSPGKDDDSTHHNIVLELAKLPNAARRLSSGPHLDSITGSGTHNIPTITWDEAEGHPALSRDTSETGRSEWVTDRGEGSYRVNSFPLDVPSGSSHEQEPLDLRAQLIEAHRGLGFVPRGTLEKIVTEDIVLETLSDVLGDVVGSERIRAYARDICYDPAPKDTRPTYRKVFAILVLLKRPQDIRRFIENQVSDDCLPLPSVLRPGRKELIYLCRTKSPQDPLPFLKQWPAGDCNEFDQKQWAMVAPYFAKSNKHDQARLYELHEKDILPWTWIDKNHRGGGFSQVTHVRIHERHHEFKDFPLGDGSFAVKRLVADQQGSFGPEQTEESQRESDDRRERDLKKDFEAEVGTLKRFSGDKSHPHLVTLLTTFKKGHDYHLLFHWAESDLLGFWKDKRPGSPLDAENLRWMIEQCRGIADGLNRIHNYQLSLKSELKGHIHPDTHTSHDASHDYGRHTDIKPENFLLYRKKGDPEDRGTIKLTDFGLCEFHKDGTRSRINKSQVVAITPTYRPPECDMDQGLISRSFDIWSLGCVYLEFITWYLGGWAYLSDFMSSRKLKDIYGFNSDQFFEIVTTPDGKFAARVKIEVVHWISTLHAHPNCSAPLHEFLNLIHDCMLVVEARGVDSHEIKRASSRHVFHKLDEICKSLSSNVVPAPWVYRRVNSPDAVEAELNNDAKKHALLRKAELKQHDGRTLRKSTTWNGTVATNRR